MATLLASLGTTGTGAAASGAAGGVTAAATATAASELLSAIGLGAPAAGSTAALTLQELAGVAPGASGAQLAGGALLAKELGQRLGGAGNVTSPEGLAAQGDPTGNLLGNIDVIQSIFGAGTPADAESLLADPLGASAGAASARAFGSETVGVPQLSPADLLKPGAEAKLAQADPFFKQVGSNLKDVQTFVRENPGGAFMAATNNLGLGRAGEGFFKDTFLDAGKEISDLTPEQLANSRRAIGSLAQASGNVSIGEREGQEAQAFAQGLPVAALPAPAQAFNPQALDLLSSIVPAEAPAGVAFGGGGSEAEAATGRPVRPEGLVSSSARGVPEDDLTALQAQAFDEVAARDTGGINRPFTDLRGPFGGTRIGEQPGETAAANVTEGVRRRFLPDELSAPEATSGVARFFTELIRSQVPGGSILPSRPTFKFPNITEDLVNSEEVQTFLRENPDPFTRAVAFSTDSRSLNALMSLPSQAFRQIFPETTGFTLNSNERFSERQPGVFNEGSVQQVVDRRPTQTLIGTGEGRIPAGRQVFLQDDAQIRQLLNDQEVIQLAPGVDPNERLRLFDRGTNDEVILTRAQLAVATRDPEIQQRLFGDAKTPSISGTIGGNQVLLSTNVAQELSQLPKGNPARFEPDVRRGPTTTVNVRIGEGEARKRFEPTESFITGLSEAGDILQQIASGELGTRSVGGIGRLAEVISGTTRLFSKEGGQFFLDLIAGGEQINSEDFSKHRQQLNNFAVGAMDAIIGQDPGTRVSDRDIELVRSSVGVVEQSSDVEKVKGAIMAITAVRLVKNTIQQASIQEPSHFPVDSEANAGRTFDVLVNKFHFSERQAEALVERLIDVEDQLKEFDFNVGGIVGQIEPGSFGLPAPRR